MWRKLLKWSRSTKNHIVYAPRQLKMTRTVRVELEIRNTQKGNRIKRKREREREQRIEKKSEETSEQTYLILWIPLLEVTGPHRLHLCSANNKHIQRHTHTHTHSDTSPALLFALSQKNFPAGYVMSHQIQLEGNSCWVFYAIWVCCVGNFVRSTFESREIWSVWEFGKFLCCCLRDIWVKTI